MDQQIWQWTLTKEAVAPCFVRDVLAMREHASRDGDFFWLGHTPCRTVLLVGMVVAIQLYDKRAIYTIDDGTAVIDCMLRHPQPAPPEPKPRSPPRPNGGPAAMSNTKHSSPKKARLDKPEPQPPEPPPPITEPGYPVRIVGRVARHYESKQIHVDTIDPCPSSLDEIAHLERVIELHKTTYSRAVPFVPPPKPTSRAPFVDSPIRGADAVTDTCVLATMSHMGPKTVEYSLAPPPAPMPLQSRNRPPSVSTNPHSVCHNHTCAPSSPIASSIASSTPSSPCKLSNAAKTHEATSKPKLRHPSRLHTRDLTGNTFRLYVKHYMDNAPPLHATVLASPSQTTREVLNTPTKHRRHEEVVDESTPRPRTIIRTERDEDDRLTRGFTLSHLRRVPELALLAARVVRAEARKREKAEGGRGKANSPSADLPRKKIKRLFSWAVVKLHEEGSIVLWDGDVRPLPVPPSPISEGGGAGDERSGLWRDTQNKFGDPSAPGSRSYARGDSFLSTISSASAAMLYSSSASASLYSHYHPPRRSTKRHAGNADGDVGAAVDDVDADADPGNVSEPRMDEEAYVPLTPQLLARYVREAIGVLRRERGHGGRSRGGATADDIAKCLQRKDSRWAKVGVWAVEEALVVLRGGEDR